MTPEKATEWLREIQAQVFNIGMPEWTVSVELAIDALKKQSADGCEGCKYIYKDEYEMPCLICKRSKMDKWTEDKE